MLCAHSLLDRERARLLGKRLLGANELGCMALVGFLLASVTLVSCSPSGVDTDCLTIRALQRSTAPPSSVALLYQVEDCHGRVGTFIPHSRIGLSTHYVLAEGGTEIAAPGATVELQGPQRAYVTLLVDFSSATLSVRSEMLKAAASFAEELAASSKEHRTTPVAVAGLSGVSQLAAGGAFNTNIALGVGMADFWSSTPVAVSW